MEKGFTRAAALALAALLTTGCADADPDPAGDVAVTGQSPDGSSAEPAALSGQQAQGQARTPPDLRLEVNLTARELYVYRGGERVATHPVAVGSEEWPTPTGEWSIGQVVWNPRWIPPEEEWAEEEEIREPGDPENPLGRAQLVYRAPNSIHGTSDESSLGKAVSHGSIRVSNDVAVDLARQVMEAGGAARDESWYRQARENTSERRDVAIPNPVPIRVVAGSGGG